MSDKKLNKIISHKSSRTKNKDKEVVKPKMDMGVVQKRLLNEVQSNKIKLFNSVKNNQSESTGKQINSDENTRGRPRKYKTKKNENQKEVDNQSTFLRDINYEEKSRKYLAENYTMKLLTMITRMIMQNPDAVKINTKFPLHTIILKMCRYLLINEVELTILSIFIERLGWSIEHFDVSQYIFILGLLSKLNSNKQVDCENVIKAVYHEVPGLEEAFHEFIRFRLENEKYNIMDIKICDINSKFLELSEPFNAYCKEDYLDYNFCVDQILSMSLPYSENRRNQNATNKMNTITVPTFKQENNVNKNFNKDEFLGKKMNFFGSTSPNSFFQNIYNQQNQSLNNLNNQMLYGLDLAMKYNNKPSSNLFVNHPNQPNQTTASSAFLNNLKNAQQQSSLQDWNNKLYENYAKDNTFLTNSSITNPNANQGSSNLNIQSTNYSVPNLNTFSSNQTFQAQDNYSNNEKKENKNENNNNFLNPNSLQYQQMLHFYKMNSGVFNPNLLQLQELQSGISPYDFPNLKNNFSNVNNQFPAFQFLSQEQQKEQNKNFYDSMNMFKNKDKEEESLSKKGSNIFSFFNQNNQQQQLNTEQKFSFINPMESGMMSKY